MRYAYPREQLAWRDEVRRFLQKAVTPALVAEMRQAGNEGDGPLARAFHRQMFEKGWWAIGWPKEFGGLGKSAVEQYIFIDEMMAAGAPAMRLAVSSVAPTILRVGSEEQKARWLPSILKGEIDFAVAYSEPDAGTDLASLKTRAVLDGDQWVVNGQKIWNTGAHTASHNWVAVRTEPEAPKHKGISMLIVPMDRPGITVQPLWTWSGIRTNAVFFEDVRVPRDRLVGERGMGFYYVMMALDFERIMIGAVGMIRRMLDELIAFVRRTKRDGRPLGSVPWVRRALADLEMRVEVGRQIGLLNAWLIDQGEVPTKEGSIAKVYVTELNAHLASVGMEILGLAGQLAAADPAGPLGWCGYGLAAAHGGQGASLLDVGLLVEEIGRAAAPFGVFAAIAGGLALAALGTPAQRREWLPAIARGEKLVTLAVAEESASAAPAAFATVVRRGGQSLRLEGEKRYVLQGVTAAAFLVAARDGRGVSAVLVPADAPGVSVRPQQTFGKDRQSAVRFRDVALPRSALAGRPG